jgi:lipid A 3-O-deacylase
VAGCWGLLPLPELSPDVVPFGHSYQVPRILTLAILAASASAHAEAQERARAISFGTGWYDFVQKRDPAMEARVEYRVGPAARPLRGIVVATMTGDAAMFLGVGIGYELKLGRRWMLTPTFTPGYYREGKGKDLGYPLEFRSQLEIGYEFRRGYRVLMAVSHSSNAGLGRSNPGQETLTLAGLVPLGRHTSLP